MKESILMSIEKQAVKLSIQDHIKLIEKLTKQLKSKSINLNTKNDWNDLYGLGKGLWNDEDAQDHVDALREDRI
jgi:hypothetical protein